MKYKAFQKIQLSRLGMGNMRLPILPDGETQDIDVQKAQEIIDYAMANGINYYDTAYVYHGGASEGFLGQALGKYPRDSYYLATKFSMRASADYKAMFREQLEKLQTDHVDFYLLHCVDDSNVEQYLTCGCIDYFLEQKRLGKIRYLGFSSHGSPATLEKMASHHQWDFVQIQLNYFDWLYGTAKEEYEVLKARNIPVMVMESIRGGRLANLTPDAEAMLKQAHPDWSIPAWGFRWLKRLSQVQVALSGMSALDQIVDNIHTFDDDVALTDEEEALLFQVCELFHDQVKVPCTACRYCCEDCPMEINIPEILEVYNSYKLNGALALRKLAEVKSKGMPKDCIGCGSCASHCPQNISIPEIMAELAEVQP